MYFIVCLCQTYKQLQNLKSDYDAKRQSAPVVQNDLDELKASIEMRLEKLGRPDHGRRNSLSEASKEGSLVSAIKNVGNDTVAA